MFDTSHLEVTWARIQAAFKESPLFTSLSLPERERLHQVLGRLRIEYDWHDLDIDLEVGTASQITTLETLRRCFSYIAALRTETAPTLRGVTAALEHAARERAEAVSSRISELQAAIDGIHAKASGTGLITKQDLMELRRLTARVDEEHSSLPFDPADPSAPFLFVNRLVNDASAAAAIVREAMKMVRPAGSSIQRPEGRLSGIEWLAGEALPEVYKAFSGKDFSVYISDKSISPGLAFVQAALNAMNLSPKGKRSKEVLFSPQTLKVYVRTAGRKRTDYTPPKKRSV